MSVNNAAPERSPNAQGALAAPTSKHGLGRKIWQVVKTVQARLRFFVLLAAVGGVILYWDRINSVYEKWTRPAVAQETADADSEYYCSMHPTVVSDHPGDCPICGMALSKRKKHTGGAEALPPGVVSRLQLTPERVALAGIATAPVEYRTLTRQIDAAGFVEFDESKLTRITNHISGHSRIDKLFVNVTDQPVAKGDPLVLLYSPDLDADMQNLLTAHRGGDKNTEQMIRDRLLNWGIADDQIDTVIQTGKPITQLTIRSPVSGHVLKKYQLEGDYIDEGARLFDVADLSTVWIEAQIFEDELAFLHKGLVVHAFPKAYPNREFTSKLTFIHPHLDAETRTLKVRFDLDNPNHVLRPGMYARVQFDVPATDLPASSANVEVRQAARAAADLAFHALLSPAAPAAGSGLASLMLSGGEQAYYQKGEVLAIPESAVIDAGSRKVVYRESGPNLYDGVEVELGPRCEGFYPVVKGLEAGDRVATAGSFLIDAETKLSGGLGSTYSGAGGGTPSNGTPVAPTPAPSTTTEEDTEIAQGLSKLSPEDRKLAKEQAYCPYTDLRLGKMGTPPVVQWADGRKVYLCCPQCIAKAQEDERGTLDKLVRLKAAMKDKPSAK
jgi:Cu(I)/Ag(I) efflux system membrane fusion protein